MLLQHTSVTLLLLHVHVSLKPNIFPSASSFIRLFVLAKDSFRLDKEQLFFCLMP